MVEQRFRKARVGGSNPPVGSMKKEQKKAILIGFAYLLVSFFLVFLVFKYGIKLAVEISLFFQKKDKSQEIQETIIPSPVIANIPLATNSSSLKINGYSTPNQKVIIFINDLETKTIEADSEGKFEGFISLALGNNKIYAVAENPNGKRSEASSTWNVFFNDTPPFLEILEPKNESIFKRNQNPVEIKGKTDKFSKVYINDQRIVVDENGNFVYTLTLQKGENKVKITAIDPAENQKELEWTLHYQP